MEVDIYIRTGLPISSHWSNRVKAEGYRFYFKPENKFWIRNLVIKNRALKKAEFYQYPFDLLSPYSSLIIAIIYLSNN